MTQGSLRLRVQGKGRAGLRIGFSRGLGRLGSAAWTSKGLQCRYIGVLVVLDVGVCCGFVPGLRASLIVLGCSAWRPS